MIYRKILALTLQSVNRPSITAIQMKPDIIKTEVKVNGNPPIYWYSEKLPLLSYKGKLIEFSF